MPLIYPVLGQNMTNSILEARNVIFEYRHGFPTLKDINIAFPEGQNIGIVGESGSGKSTLLRLLLGIHRPSSGEILFMNKKLDLSDRERSREFRRSVQVVFQDPYSSLDPRQRIDRLIAEPLRSLGLSKGKLEAWVNAQIADALTSVGLSTDSLLRYPSEFSGGQRQRIAIARAIVCNPKILLADEPVSALDVTTRVHIIELLSQLSKTRGLTIAMVSHDLSVVASLCNQTIVLKKGEIVEYGNTAGVLGSPSQPYTQKLIESLPRLPH